MTLRLCLLAPALWPFVFLCPALPAPLCLVVARRLWRHYTKGVLLPQRSIFGHTKAFSGLATLRVFLYAGSLADMSVDTISGHLDSLSPP